LACRHWQIVAILNQTATKKPYLYLYQQTTTTDATGATASLAPLLREGVSRLLLHDPFVPSVPELRSRRINYVEDALQLFKRCSVVFIATNHSQYAINSQDILAQARLNNVFITDIWNTLEAGAAYINNACAPDYDDVPGSFRMGP
jgi:UDP-N-acetyl-D-mannosaminuronate dehydrogenase